MLTESTAFETLLNYNICSWECENFRLPSHPIVEQIFIWSELEAPISSETNGFVRNTCKRGREEKTHENRGRGQSIKVNTSRRTRICERTHQITIAIRSSHDIATTINIVSRRPICTGKRGRHEKQKSDPNFIRNQSDTAISNYRRR